MVKLILLLSGGIDSSILFGWLKDRNIDVLPLFVDYGQTNKNMEMNAIIILRIFNKSPGNIKINR